MSVLKSDILVRISDRKVENFCCCRLLLDMNRSSFFGVVGLVLNVLLLFTFLIVSDFF